MPGILLVAFSLLIVTVVSRDGYSGWIRIALSNSSAGMTLVDMSIALSLVTVWMFNDARARGAKLWPFVVLTLALGSVGPLAYLVVRPASDRRADPKGD